MLFCNNKNWQYLYELYKRWYLYELHAIEALPIKFWKSALILCDRDKTFYFMFKTMSFSSVEGGLL